VHPKMFGMSGIIRYACEKQQTEPGWENLPMDEIVERCGPLWENLGEEEKNRYNQKKKKSKKKNSDQSRTDSFNRNLEDIERQIQLRKGDPEMMRAKIRSQYGDIQDIENIIFTLIHTNIFVKTDAGKMIPAEICVANFSLKKGIIEIYHEFPAAGDIPQGYRYECTAWADRSHKIPLDLAYANPNYHNIIQNIQNFMFNKKTQDGKLDSLLFTVSSERKQTRELLDFLQSASVHKTNRVCDGGEEKFPGQVLDIAYLLLHIHYYQVDECEMEAKTGLWSTYIQTLEDKLITSKFMWHNIACNFHDTDSTYCSQALVKNWIFNICWMLCPLMNIEMLPGYHQPSTALKIENIVDEEDLTDEVASQSELSSVFSDYRLNSDFQGNDSDNSDASADLRLEVRQRLEQIRRKQSDNHQDFLNGGEVPALEFKKSGAGKSRLDLVKQKIRQKKLDKQAGPYDGMANMTAMRRALSSCSSISDNNNWYDTADTSFSDSNSYYDGEGRAAAGVTIKKTTSRGADMNSN